MHITQEQAFKHESKLGCTFGGVNYLVIIACQMRVTVGDSGLCCCVCVTSFER